MCYLHGPGRQRWCRDLFNLHNGRPKNGSRSRVVSSPERGVAKVFGFENNSEERIFIVSNVKGSMSKKTSVNNVEVPDAKASIVLALTYVVPGSESNWRGGIVILHTGPPKPFDDRIDFLNKSLGEEDNRHVIDRN